MAYKHFLSFCSQVSILLIIFIVMCSGCHLPSHQIWLYGAFFIVCFQTFYYFRTFVVILNLFSSNFMHGDKDQFHFYPSGYPNDQQNAHSLLKRIFFSYVYSWLVFFYGKFNIYTCTYFLVFLLFNCSMPMFYQQYYVL